VLGGAATLVGGGATLVGGGATLVGGGATLVGGGALLPHPGPRSVRTAGAVRRRPSGSPDGITPVR